MDNKYIEKIQANDDRSKSNMRRIESLEQKYDNIYELTLSVKEIATEMRAMRSDLSEIDKRVVSIERMPLKKLDLIWGYVVSGIIGAIITFLTFKLGLK